MLHHGFIAFLLLSAVLPKACQVTSKHSPVALFRHVLGRLLHFSDPTVDPTFEY